MYNYQYFLIFFINMDPIRNPFAPGAGTPPPALSGRSTVIEAAEVALQRVLASRPDRSQMITGLRGVGKTVLLNAIEKKALEFQYKTTFLECSDGGQLLNTLSPKMLQVLRQLSTSELAKQSAMAGMSAVKSLISAFKISYEGVGVSVDAESGVADSGDMEQDLQEVFVRIGRAAKDAGTGWALFIDEVQYLSKKELSSLIVAIHRVNQLQLPVLIFAAGLPQIAQLSGDARSYAERLFRYESVGALSETDSFNAIHQPISAEGEEIHDQTIRDIIKATHGYPYFLQEWGYQVWQESSNSPILPVSVALATPRALSRLDDGFFTVRYDRLAPKEKEYVVAMARLGQGPYRSSDIADSLGISQSSLGPRRSKIIKKGMIYSPSHGDIDFTVPLFNEYIERVFPVR